MSSSPVQKLEGTCVAVLMLTVRSTQKVDDILFLHDNIRTIRLACLYPSIT